MQPNPMQQALQANQEQTPSMASNGNNALVTGDFSNTNDYHLMMSGWLHNQIESGAWSKLSGKQIVDQFKQQKGVINNRMAQDQQQFIQAMHQLAGQPLPTMTGLPTPQPAF